MVRYAASGQKSVVLNEAKIAKARGSYLRVSFKNTREASQAIKNMKVSRAITFLENVREKREAVPMRRYAGSTGRTAQGKPWGVSKARWPVKSAEFLLDLLRNASANADLKGLDTSNLIVSHVQVNQAPKQRRRTYRAHGRINPYMSNPSHIELIVAEGEEVAPKAADPSKDKRLSLKQKRRALTNQRKTITAA